MNKKETAAKADLEKARAVLKAACKDVEDAKVAYNAERLAEERRARAQEKAELEEFKEDEGGIYTEGDKEWASFHFSTIHGSAHVSIYEWKSFTGEVRVDPKSLRKIRDRLNGMNLG